VLPRTAAALPASVAELSGALDHWQEVLVQIGFLDPAAPKRLMPRLQQLINRAQPTADELHILRGIARALGRAGGRP
jgi:tRNA/rRNA methyltransferase